LLTVGIYWRVPLCRIHQTFARDSEELKRFHRKGLGYSKDLATHTAAVATGVELERWDLERVVEMTAEYCRRKEDAEFEKAFAALEC
jgi:hypothetical protein